MTVAGVADLDAKKLELVNRRYPGIRTDIDPFALIDDPKVDVIAVATPVRSHYELALAALRAGKHVMVEKPMTETADQAYRLVDEAEQRNRVLMVDHTFIYTGAVRKIRELIATGEMGEIYYYDSIRVNLGLFQGDVSVISDLAVHDMSILEYLLDQRPAAISANGASHVWGAPENLAFLTLHYDSGTVAHINVNWLAPVKVRQTLIGGNKKMVVYDDLEPSEKIKIYDRGIEFGSNPDQIFQMRIGYRTGDMWAPKLDLNEALRTELFHFAECIEHRKSPITDGKLGLSIVELVEAAHLSMKKRGELVKLKQKGK